MYVSLIVNLLCFVVLFEYLWLLLLVSLLRLIEAGESSETFL